MIGYLLGFPTPVVEIVAVLAGTVIALALYFGFRFESVEAVDPRVGGDVEQVSGDGPGSDGERGEDVEREVTG